MADEKKTEKGVEESKYTPQQSPDPTKPPEEPKSSSQSAIEQEEKRLESAAAASVERSTEKLRVSDISGLPEAALLNFRGETGTAKWFRRLPISMGTADLSPETPRWRIELVGLGSTVEPLGVEIVGDTVIGRGRVGTEPADLDLDTYNALEKGVSRRHGLLRPTTNHLYIIDLGSTNGTFHNGIPLGPGVARALKHNDTITLGRLSFTLKFIDGPTMHRLSESESPAAGTEEKDKTKPLEPLDASTIKAKKARLTIPGSEPTSPETTKLPDNAAASQMSEDEAKLPEALVPESKSAIVPPTETSSADSKPASSPATIAVKPPDVEIKPPAEASTPKVTTKPFDPDTQRMKARSPLTEPKPSAAKDAPPSEKKPEEDKSTPAKKDDAAKDG